ncbi:MAG: tail fiber domain-containing protein [Deltaproteobacteria bacterium]
MRKVSALGLLLFFSVLFPLLALADENINITTYYPSPSGVYRQVRLYPQDNLPAACSGPYEGNMYYDNVSKKINFCGSTGSYSIIPSDGPRWVANGNNINNTNSGYVGIGTGTPQAKLDIADTGTVGMRYIKSGARDSRIQIGDGVSAKRWSMAVGWATAGDFSIIEEGLSGNRIYIQQGTGYVGIGTSTPTQALHVAGDAYKSSGANTWLIPSDARLKDVKGKYKKGLKEVLLLSPVIYEYKKNNRLGINDQKEHSGVIAQDVEEVFPEAVSLDEQGFMLLHTDPIFYALINAVKEQQAEIDMLKQKVAALEARKK